MGLGKGAIRASVLAGAISLIVGFFYYGLVVPMRTMPAYDPDYKPPASLDQLTEWHLRLLPWEQLVQIYYRLGAPAEPLEGEYTALLLDCGSGFANALGFLSINPLWPGIWVGKAFVAGEGWGYNMFRWKRKAHRRLKMETSFATSIWDNKPVFELEYRRQKHSLGRLQMRDEVREVRPGLLLGMGTYGLSSAKRKEALPFLLKGPYSPPKPHLFSEEVVHDVPDGMGSE